MHTAFDSSQEQTEADNAFRELPLAVIQPKLDFNPRKYFDEKELIKLADSIKAQGVIQPIVVRPVGKENYEIIAGERRYRASQLAGKTAIPSIIRDVDEVTALILAATENEARENLGPGEEALLARRVLDKCDGDIAEACRHLGWSTRKFDARLLLLHADDIVIDALNARHIKLGHAELLAGLPCETQQGTLPKIIANDVSVEELKNKLAAFARDLGTAIFDTQECQGCPHNSSKQSSLFEQNIGEGRCSNQQCFSEKTTHQLSAIRDDASTRYNAAWLDTEKPPEAITVVLKSDVGAQQLKEGCSQCAHFGVLISSRPGEMGKVTEDVCGNLPCFQTKMADYKKMIAPESDLQTEITSQQPSGKTKATAKNNPSKPANTSSKKKAAASASPKRVVEHVETLHRQAAAAEIKKDPKMVKVYALLALIKELSDLQDLRKRALKNAGIKTPPKDENRPKLLKELYGQDIAVLDALMTDLSASVALLHDRNSSWASTNYLQAAKATLSSVGADLTQYFVVDKAFLELHTIKGIEGILRQAGFDQYYNHKLANDVAFVKLLKNKHDVIVDKVVNAGFDFTGYLPEVAGIKE